MFFTPELPTFMTIPERNERSLLEVPISVHLTAVCTVCHTHAVLSAPHGYALTSPPCPLSGCAGGVWRVPLRPLPRP